MKVTKETKKGKKVYEYITLRINSTVYKELEQISDLTGVDQNSKIIADAVHALYIQTLLNNAKSADAAQD